MPEIEQDHRDRADSARWYDFKRHDIEIWNCDRGRVPLHRMGGGRSAFLLSSGPSAKELDLSHLTRRGVVTMGVNNSPATMAAQGLRMPQLWTCVDTPKHFIEQIWKDPAVMKFAPLGHIGTKLMVRNDAGELQASAFKVEEMPNVFYYQRHARFSVDDYLTHRDFTWGNENDHRDDLGFKGGRSVMLVALKLLYYLGFKTVYLVGADFHMELGRDNYSFPQDRAEGSVRGNNATYRALDARFKALAPAFDRAGFRVFNCNPDSGLTAFLMLPYEEAVARAVAEVSKPIDTRGHYEIK